jgi:DNA-binding HxlR family transcriptional regulator
MANSHTTIIPSPTSAPGTPEPEVAPARLRASCDRYTHAVDILGRRWMGLVLRALLAGPRRFNELLAAIPGISDPLLTQRLRELEAEGLVERRVLPTSPVRVEYTLTEAGCALDGVIEAIGAWSQRWLSDDC